jgi:hypothetical protein
VLFFDQPGSYVYLAYLNLGEGIVNFRAVSPSLNEPYTTRGVFKNADTVYFASEALIIMNKGGTTGGFISIPGSSSRKGVLFSSDSTEACYVAGNLALGATMPIDYQPNILLHIELFNEAIPATAFS